MMDMDSDANGHSRPSIPTLSQHLLHACSHDYIPRACLEHDAAHVANGFWVSCW